MDKNDWETRLAHNRVLRDAIALCNGVPLNFTDPPGALVHLRPSQQRTYDGKTVRAHLTQHGHSSPDFATCTCRGKH